MIPKSQIVCLMGPTASGKTELAVQLAERFPFEIISVDSAMVYRDMDIGTAKPCADILKKAPHKLINILDPAENYSAAQFRSDAIQEIQAILQRGKIPLLVGGTMLYFSILQKGLSELPSANANIRALLTQAAERDGWAALHARLQKVDPVSASRIHPHDTQRIQRALEVYELTGKSLTQWQEAQVSALTQYEIINLALAPADRAVLHARIEKRFAAMLEQGLVAEVKKLFDRGDLNLDMPSIRAVGYRQVWAYLSGNLSYEEMQEKGIIATRQLAKRQFTWLRHWPFEIQWFDSLDSSTPQQAQDYLANVLQVRQ
jgi:tRNA dimethylallyltransferase